MRFGIMGIVTLIFLIFLIVINYTDISDEEIDETFFNMDTNLSEDFNQVSDNDIQKFAEYTVRGMIQEIHGGYYLAKWVNEFLPPIIIDNLELITVLFVLALLSPVLFYGFLLVVFIASSLHKRWKRRKGE